MRNCRFCLAQLLRQHRVIHLLEVPQVVLGARGDVGRVGSVLDCDKDRRGSKKQPFKAKLSYYAMSPCRASSQL
jgi:hypothetical protein